MSKCMLNHYYNVMQNDKSEVATCLMNLADRDCDFNGNSGLEYLWDEAEGFESNAEYCLSVAEKEPTPREMIEKFIYMWMGRDYYYEDFDIGVIVRDDKLFMSLVYTTQY